MARYWIRNRGRVQGPFSEERIHGLLRRGRFNRHFHVSEDRRNWFPASEFPELFAGAGGPEPVEDESPFGGGSSPFDDGFTDEDDDPPASIPTSERKRSSPSRRRRAEEDDDDDDDEDVSADSDDDDEEWEDDDGYVDGLFPRMFRWIERRVVLVAPIALALVGGLIWFVFFAEDFTQDLADMKTLQAIQQKVITTRDNNANAQVWISLLETTESELEPMVARLQDNANSMDMVKQELLFTARDDLPLMIKELPKGKEDAADRVRVRLTLLDEMITKEIRFHDGTALMALRNRNQQQGGQPSGPGQPGTPSGGNPDAGAQQEGPVITMDEVHNQIAGTAQPYTVAAGPALSIDTSPYTMTVPAGASPPNAIHILIGDNYYRASWNGTGKIVLNASTIELVRGQPFSGFTAGQECRASVGFEDPNTKAIKPYWAALIKVQ